MGYECYCCNRNACSDVDNRTHKIHYTKLTMIQTTWPKLRTNTDT